MPQTWQPHSTCSISRKHNLSMNAMQPIDAKPHPTSLTASFHCSQKGAFVFVIFIYIKPLSKYTSNNCKTGKKNSYTPTSSLFFHYSNQSWLKSLTLRIQLSSVLKVLRIAVITFWFDLSSNVSTLKCGVHEKL